MAVALPATLKCYVLDEEALHGNFNIIHHNLKQHYTTVQALLITDYCRRSYGRYYSTQCFYMYPTGQYPAQQHESRALNGSETTAEKKNVNIQ